MYGFFDVETDGLPKNYSARISDVNNWPHIVQIAWALYDENGYLVKSFSSIIDQDGRKLSEKVTKIHGITDKMIMRCGLPICEALKYFNIFCWSYADTMVAHNIKFDFKVVQAENIRNRLPMLTDSSMACTMLSSVDKCKLPGKYGYKWPKLQELHTKLFGTTFEGAHNAMLDVFATAKCFFALKNLGVQFKWQ